MPFFLNPFAFAAFAAVPVLIGIYYLRNRYRRRVVSSLILWQGIIKGKEGGRKRDQLQLPWLFILEILAIILLALASTQPYFRFSSGRIPVSVVLDDSFSMLAKSTDDSGEILSVRERAIKELEELIDQNVYEFEFVLAGENPVRIGESVVTSRGQLEKVLLDWKCQQSSAGLNDALQQVKNMHSDQSRILVFTDHVPEFKALEGDPVLRWVSLGSPEENVAISFASRNSSNRDNATEEQLLIKLERFSPNEDEGAKTVGIEIKDQKDDSVLARSSCELAPQSSKEVRLNLPGSTRDRDLKIEIEDDAVSSDNHITLLAESPPELSVFLAIDDKNYRKYWLDALQVIPNVKVNNKSSIESHIVITQNRFELKNEQWHIYCPKQKKPIGFAGPYALSNGHPLTNGLPINNAIWAATPARDQELNPEIENERKSGSGDDEADDSETGFSNAGKLSVIRSGQTDLVTETLLPNKSRRIQINLEPGFSTIHLSPPSWLVMVVNLVKWREANLHGPEFKNTWRNSQSVHFPVDIQEAKVTTPGGEKYSVQVFDGRAKIETFENGVWQVEYSPDSESNEKPVVWQWSYFSMSAHESDLSDSETEIFDNWIELETETRVYYQPFAWLFGVIGLGFFVAGCFFSTRSPR